MTLSLSVWPYVQVKVTVIDIGEAGIESVSNWKCLYHLLVALIKITCWLFQDYFQ